MRALKSESSLENECISSESDYSGFSFNSTPKFGLKWSPVRGVHITDYMKDGCFLRSVITFSPLVVSIVFLWSVYKRKCLSSEFTRILDQSLRVVTFGNVTPIVIKMALFVSKERWQFKQIFL